MTVSTVPSCPVCGARAAGPAVLDWRSLPVFCNVLMSDRAAALSAPRADIRLVQCPTCTLVHNEAFDEALAAYAPGYENALHHSAVFRQFSDDLVERLVRERSLGGGLVVEVGSGGGSFLRDLCERAGARGIGFDPSRPADEDDGRVQLRAQPFPADGALDADLIVSRHVFEHLPQPVVVMAAIAAALQRSASSACYLEVPDGDYMLRAGAVWDVIYEHCSYFTAASLHHLVTAAGVSVTRLESAFGGQYLWLEAEAAGTSISLDAEVLDTTLRAGAEFGGEATRIVDRWRERIGELAARGPVVAWGAGSKGVTFLNLMPAGTIDAIVDLNPLKHGKFVPVTGHEVVAPTQLAERSPSSVVVMNPLYVDEVRAAVAALGLDAEVVAAH